MLLFSVCLLLAFIWATHAHTADSLRMEKCKWKYERARARARTYDPYTRQRLTHTLASIHKATRTHAAAYTCVNWANAVVAFDSMRVFGLHAKTAKWFVCMYGWLLCKLCQCVRAHTLYVWPTVSECSAILSFLLDSLLRVYCASWKLCTWILPLVDPYTCVCVCVCSDIVVPMCLLHTIQCERAICVCQYARMLYGFVFSFTHSIPTISVVTFFVVQIVCTCAYIARSCHWMMLMLYERVLQKNQHISHTHTHRPIVWQLLTPSNYFFSHLKKAAISYVILVRNLN